MKSKTAIRAPDWLWNFLRSSNSLSSAAKKLAWEAIRLSQQQSFRASRKEYREYWAESARMAIETTLRTPQNLRGVLARLGLSYRQMSRYLKEVTGLSPKEYQVTARIREARRLLAATRLSVTDIAYDLAYSSSQHFTAQFRRHTGSSPQEFRRNPSGAPLSDS